MMMPTASSDKSQAFGQLFGTIFGDITWKQNNVPQDYAQALAWFEKAATDGNIQALYATAYMYEEGKGTAADPIKALFWYKKSAEQGDTDASDKLGNIYYYGKGVQKDYAVAFSWYNKAATAGNSNSEYHLGYMYLYGQGIQKNTPLAYDWLKKAANQKYVPAQVQLGIMYESDKDYDMAFYWDGLAAKAGDATAQYNLAYLYMEGKGTKVNWELASYWFEKSADAGNIDAIAKVALEYEIKGLETNIDNNNCDISGGDCRKKDSTIYFKKAFFWAKKGADKNDSDSECVLGDLYLNGYGVAEDRTLARFWLQKAADQGNLAAAKELKKMDAKPQ